jgi:hypothetical protein
MLRAAASFRLGLEAGLGGVRHSHGPNKLRGVLSAEPKKSTSNQSNTQTSQPVKPADAREITHELDALFAERVKVGLDTNS